MGEKSRDETGRFARGVEDGDMLAAVRAHDPAATSEIAEEVGISRQGADRRLRELRNAGKVSSKKIGASLVWFMPREHGRPSTWGSPDAPSAGENDRSYTRADTPPTDAGDESADTRPESDTLDDDLQDLDFPAGRDLEACSAAVYAARDYLRDHGPATMREIVAEVLPEHPLGYDVDDALAKVEAGDRYRGAWWRRVVKPGLKALPGVEAPPQGASDWRYSADPVKDADVYDPTEEF